MEVKKAIRKVEKVEIRQIVVDTQTQEIRNEDRRTAKTP